MPLLRSTQDKMVALTLQAKQISIQLWGEIKEAPPMPTTPVPREVLDYNI